jgi:predicted DCC family thiol-disulfide oxidoreductase YuxK
VTPARFAPREPPYAGAMVRPGASRAPTPAELAAAAPHLPLALYDGDCVFCTAQAERARRLSGGRLRIAPLQTALADVPWVDPEEAVKALQLVDRDGRVYAGAAAVVRLLRLTRPVLGLLALPYHLPGVRWLADRAYDAVAARRYAIAGRTDDGCADGACGVPWAARHGAARHGAARHGAAHDGEAPSAPPRPADQSTITGRPAARSVLSSTPPSRDSNQRE